MIELSYNLKNTTIVVTGAASGICASLAGQCANLGARVIGLDILTEFSDDPLRKFDTSDVKLLKMDIRSEKAIKATFENIRKEFGHIDVLVNGVGPYPHTLLKDLPLQEWQFVMECNLQSVYLCTKYFAHGHNKKKSAAIVNFGTINGIFSEETFTHYAAAKAGVMMFTKSSALELAKDNIRVNAVAPGLVDTPGLRKNDPARTKRFIERAPLGFVGTYEDIANVVLFLAAKNSRFITGQTIIADGGVTLAPTY